MRLTCIFLYLLLIGCTTKPNKKAVQASVKPEITDSIYPILTDSLKAHKRNAVYRYESFDIVFYGFKGYDYDFKMKQFYFILNDRSDTYSNESIRVENSSEIEGVKEIARVVGDTLQITENNRWDEEMFGDFPGIENIEDWHDMLTDIRLQIVPKQKGDSYRLSVAYQYSFIGGWTEIPSDSMSPPPDATIYSIDGTTDYFPIEDSLGYFFRLFPDDEAEKKLWDEYYPPYMHALKKKHKIKNIDVEVEGEWGPTRYIFEKDGHHLSFNCTGVILKVRSYNGNRLVETQFIEIQLDGRSGC